MPNLGPQEDKFAELYKTFNRYNKEKEKNNNCGKSAISEVSDLSFTQKSKGKQKNVKLKGRNKKIFMRRIR